MSVLYEGVMTLVDICYRISEWVMLIGMSLLGFSILMILIEYNSSEWDNFINKYSLIIAKIALSGIILCTVALGLYFLLNFEALF